jgi:hypothetical protein
MPAYSPVRPGVALAHALGLLLSAYPPPKTRAQIEAWNAAQRALEVWAVSLRNPDVHHENRIPK